MNNEELLLTPEERKRVIGCFTRNVIYTERQRNEGLLSAQEWSSEIFKHEEEFEAQLAKFEKHYEAAIVTQNIFHKTQIEEAKREEKERIKKAINNYYAKPDVEQGIVGFREAVRRALKEGEK